MYSLKEIFWAHNKNLSDKWENYIDTYSKHFDKFIQDGRPIRLLEIGVQNGGSLQIWKDFFPEGSEFVGIDINPKCELLELGDNIDIYCCDVNDEKKFSEILSDQTFDIIIDDGSHQSKDIISTFLNCIFLLNPKGLYIIEDLHCSYDKQFGGGLKTQDSALQFFKNITDTVNYHHIPALEKKSIPNLEQFHNLHKMINSITFYESLVIIETSSSYNDHYYKRLLTGSEFPVYNTFDHIETLVSDVNRTLVVSHPLLSKINNKYHDHIEIYPSLYDTLLNDNSYLYKYINTNNNEDIIIDNSIAPVSTQNEAPIQHNYSYLKKFKRKWKNSIKKRLHYIGLAKTPVVKEVPKDIILPVPSNHSKNIDDLVKRFNVKNVKETKINQNIKFSILITVYNTPPHLLERLLKTVLLQNYKNFEVVIVDDCSTNLTNKEILERFKLIDNRITVIYNDTNLGISAAHNVGCIAATGEYIALVDHDDELTWDALEAVAECIQKNPDADLIYSDECILNEDNFPLQIFAKPDWSPLYLTNCMYLGHLSVYRASIIKKVGGFRSEFDFSQDYDLALRVTETTNAIYHIPKTLYGWRAIAASAAGGGKDFARITNIAALQAAVDRKNWHGTAIPLPYANRIKWTEPEIWPMVSIIIPSDNINNITDTIHSIKTKTSYPNYEIIVVTNSKVISDLKSQSHIVFVPYDKPFNFSDKCNQGAIAAKGDYLVFFNDDVRILDQDWLERLIEIARIDGVGAVSPKMLYENNTVQHAGMVTGVRRLVGTAFHCLPETQNTYFNMPTQLREVSLLCGACFVVSSVVFSKINGFDSVNAPIAHSDVDLCFKIRELNYTCVYQPDVKLLHIGHQSIAETEKNETKKIDKSDIYLLKRWPEQTAIDPYFTQPMRELLYHDSPEPYTVYPGKVCEVETKGDILIISHDLTNSGAPRVVVEMAKNLKNEGYFVVVAAPEDGPLRQELQSLGFNVIIDSILFTQHESVLSFARNFDLVIANTIVSWPIIKQLDPVLPVMWYIHEVELISDIADSNPDCAKILRDARHIFAVSQYALNIISKYRTNPTPILETGFPQLERKSNSYTKLRFSTFGSYESRKGQDLLLAAMKLLPNELISQFEIVFHGREHDKEFKKNLEKQALLFNNVVIGEELSHGDCIQETELSDLIIIPSRSDTLPIVGIDALGAGIPIMCTYSNGLSQYITHNISGFIVEEATPQSLAKGIENALSKLSQWHDIGHRGREVFEKNFSQRQFSQNLLKYVEDAFIKK